MESIVEIFKPTADSGLSLKPCPFCGSNEIFYSSYASPSGIRWKVTCAHCMAGVDTGYAQVPSLVRDRWNKRVAKGGVGHG